MFTMKDMVEEISKVSGLSQDDIEKKIEEKQLELSGLVSPEGAAYIVGKELGVNLLKENAGHGLKIKNVLPGLRSVDVTCRILNISGRKDFERDGKTKGVVNLTLGDETGILRLSLWDLEIELIERLDLRENDVISIRNGYVKENKRGDAEIRLGRLGRINKSDAAIPDIKEMTKNSEGINPKSISELCENDYSEVKASLIQLFKRSPFFEVCPKCESRLEKDGEAWKCKDHGITEPKFHLFLSGIIDDGSGNMRAVFFRDVAERILGKDADTLKKISLTNSDPEAVYQNAVLGGEYFINGRVKKNQFTEKLEFVANSIEDIDPVKESKKIIHKIEELEFKEMK